MSDVKQEMAVGLEILRDLACADGHDKAYSNLVQLTYPAMRRWICRRCLAEGVERATATLDDYLALKVRKAREGRP